MFHLLEERVQETFHNHIQARYGIDLAITIEQPKQPDFGEGRMFLGFSAQSIVRVEKYDVGTVEGAPLACPHALRSARGGIGSR